MDNNFISYNGLGVPDKLNTNIVNSTTDYYTPTFTSTTTSSTSTDSDDTEDSSIDYSTIFSAKGAPSYVSKGIASESSSTTSEVSDEDYIDFIQLCQEEGIPIKVTSGYRAGAVTKNGSKSYHSEKDDHGNSRAYDIQPYFNGKVDKSDAAFTKLRNALYSNKRIVNWLKTRGMGILEETDSTTMSKTGATGKHFHIGPDQSALAQTSSRLGYNLYAKRGGIIKELKQWKTLS